MLIVRLRPWLGLLELEELPRGGLCVFGNMCDFST